MTPRCTACQGDLGDESKVGGRDGAEVRELFFLGECLVEDVGAEFDEAEDGNEGEEGEDCKV